HVRHHIVAKSALVRRHRIEVDVGEMCTHLRDRFVRNRHAELALGLGERQPELAPQSVPLRRRPELEHRSRRVALGQRRRVATVIGHRTRNCKIRYCPCRSTTTLRYPRLPLITRATSCADEMEIRLIWMITSPF